MACAAALVLLTAALERALGGVFFAFPLTGLALVTLALGVGPGVVLTALTGLGIWFFLLPPTRSFAPLSSQDAGRLAGYFAAGTSIVLVASALDRVRRRLAAARATDERTQRELRETQAQLRQLAGSREREREQADERLRDATSRLEDSERRKNEFLGVLSHELRNPLTPVRNSVQILARAAPGSEQAKRAQAVIDRQVTHMSRLIDDLLDITRISRGKIRLHPERVELRSVVHGVAEDLRSVFTVSGVELEVVDSGEDLVVYGDRTRLAQVVGNLLQNASKFTPPRGRTAVSVQSERGEAVIRVVDDGAGIAPEMLLALFEPFTQAERTLDRTRGGLGLGLALVKALVELHGGTVSAASAGVGRGAEFTVRIPLAEPARAGADGASGEHAEAGGRRVLVIEDNIDAADSLKVALELGDHVVEIAHTGPEGLAKAQRFRPDIIICDIGLPLMDGYEVARAMRVHPDLRSVPLIALTGYALPEDVQRAREAGFDRHLAKPPDLLALETALAQVAVHPVTH